MNTKTHTDRKKKTHVQGKTYQKKLRTISFLLNMTNKMCRRKWNIQTSAIVCHLFNLIFRDFFFLRLYLAFDHAIIVKLLIPPSNNL